MGHDPTSKNQGQLRDDAESGLLDDVVISSLPNIPKGKKLESVEVVVNIKD